MIRIKECISDPKLAEFDFDECPSLQRMLDALNLGNSNPAVTCELSCIAQFDKVGGWVGGCQLQGQIRGACKAGGSLLRGCGWTSPPLRVPPPRNRCRERVRLIPVAACS